MRTMHLLDRGLNATPVPGLVVITLLIAFGGLLGSLPFGLVAMRVQETPRIVINFVHVHGTSSLSRSPESVSAPKWTLASR